jgi:hypothetical protein
VLDDMEPVHDAPGVGQVLAHSFPEARAHVARVSDCLCKWGCF